MFPRKHISAGSMANSTVIPSRALIELAVFKELEEFPVIWCVWDDSVHAALTEFTVLDLSQVQFVTFHTAIVFSH